MAKLESLSAPHRPPDFTLNVWIVEHGIEAAILRDETIVHSWVRDFAGSYTIEAIFQSLQQAIWVALEEWRKGL